MASTTTIACDICKKDITNLPSKACKGIKIPVLFTTEQTEGRFTEPYISIETIDVCQECVQQLKDTYPLLASGAQGYNTYWWRNSK